VTKIIEWLISGPKLTGGIEQVVTGTISSSASNSYLGAHVMLNVYVVNRRIKPTTVKGFEVFARINGEWKRAELTVIPEGFKLSDIAVEFSKSRLYDKVGLELLQYGKGVHGWLRMTFLGEPVEQVRLADWRVELTDAFDKKHIIKQRYRPGTGGAVYFPDSGINQN
jgi:hypothetical protein